MRELHDPLEVVQAGAELDLTGGRLMVEVVCQESQALLRVGRGEIETVCKEVRPLGRLFGLNAGEFEPDKSPRGRVDEWTLSDIGYIDVFDHGRNKSELPWNIGTKETDH